MKEVQKISDLRPQTDFDYLCSNEFELIGTHKPFCILYKNLKQCFIPFLLICSYKCRIMLSRCLKCRFPFIQKKLFPISSYLSTFQPKMKVALVGRPNVGKSTLFNRLTKTRTAIVTDVPGTTRDRKHGIGYLAGMSFELIDTGGLDDRGVLSDNIKYQIEAALTDAHVILFLVDSRSGITTQDLFFAKWIRKQMNTTGNNNDEFKLDEISKKIIVVANKTEGGNLSEAMTESITEATRFGFGDPILISAVHGDGMADLATALALTAKEKGLDDGDNGDEYDDGHRNNKKNKNKKLNKKNNHINNNSNSNNNLDDSYSIHFDKFTKKGHSNNQYPNSNEYRTIQLAIMGRPNVGKSTLFNALLGTERSISGPIAGITRDAVHVEWTYKDDVTEEERKMRLVDTAGLNRVKPRKALLLKEIDGKTKSKQQTMGSTKSLRASTIALKHKSLPGSLEMNPEDDPSQHSYQVAELSLVAALNALRFAQVVLLVVEVGQGKFNKTDLQLARHCLEEGRALVICANKADLAEVSIKEYERGVEEHAQQLLDKFGKVMVVAGSSIKDLEGIEIQEPKRQGFFARYSNKNKEDFIEGDGEREGLPEDYIIRRTHKRTREEFLGRIMRSVLRAHDAWDWRVDTSVLNNWLRDLLVTQPVPMGSIRIKFITQVGTRPPTFTLFCNTDTMPHTIERFIRKRMQTDFRLKGVPIRFRIKKTKDTRTNVNAKTKSRKRK